MIHPADPILKRRSRSGRKRWGLGVSLAAHALLAASAFLIPSILASEKPQIEFVKATIVPVQALGVPEPEPEPEQPAAPEPQRPAPPKESRPAAPSPNSTRKPVEKRPEPSAPQTPRPRQRRGSPLGSELASSPFGAKGVGLDSPDFTYGYYVDQLLAMIGGRWTRPRVDGQPETLLFFRIQRDGRVTDLALAETSGLRVFDDAAMRAVQEAAPLPPLPASYDKDSLGVTLLVR